MRLVHLIKNLNNAMFYAAGDTYTVTNIPLVGLITNSSKTIAFNLSVDKSMRHVSATVTSFKGGIRVPSGGYVNNINNDSTEWVGASGITFATGRRGERNLEIVMSSTNAFTNVTNNTPLVILATMTITFA